MEVHLEPSTQEKILLLKSSNEMKFLDREEDLQHWEMLVKDL